MNTESSIITFYSYKGGVGCTFSLANVAVILAQWGFRVLCIDWALEAPGLHLYFESRIGAPKRGLVEMITAFMAPGEVKWQDYLTSVDDVSKAGKLSLICAGQPSSDYFERMQALDWSDLYEKHRLGVVLEDWRQEWKTRYDFILIDSHPGITDTSGICTVQLPDILVLLATANQQNLDGINHIAQSIKHERDRLPFDRAQLLMLPIVARFETRVGTQGQDWLDKFARELRHLYTPWLHKDLSVGRALQELLNHILIPSAPDWSFGERLPAIEKGADDHDDIIIAFETLAALLAHHLTGHERLLHDRDAYVGVMRRQAMFDRQEGPLRIFISYAYQDVDFCDEIKLHINGLRHQGIVGEFSDQSLMLTEDGQEKFMRYIEEANLILLLVSAQFLKSDFMYHTGMPRVLERHMAGEAQVIPILVRPVDWHYTPIAQLQALPSNGRPITSWLNQDEAWTDVARGIRQAIGSFRVASS